MLSHNSEISFRIHKINLLIGMYNVHILIRQKIILQCGLPLRELPTSLILSAETAKLKIETSNI